MTCNHTDMSALVYIGSLGSNAVSVPNHRYCLSSRCDAGLLAVRLFDPQGARGVLRHFQRLAFHDQSLAAGKDIMLELEQCLQALEAHAKWHQSWVCYSPGLFQPQGF